MGGPRAPRGDRRARAPPDGAIEGAVALADRAEREAARDDPRPRERAVTGARCDHAEGLYVQPAGTFIVMAIGTMRWNPINSAPTRVSFAYAAASGAQKTSGAINSHSPTVAPSHDTSPRFGLRAATAKPSATTPLITSLHASARLE